MNTAVSHHAKRLEHVTNARRLGVRVIAWVMVCLPSLMLAVGGITFFIIDGYLGVRGVALGFLLAYLSLPVAGLFFFLLGTSSCHR